MVYGRVIFGDLRVDDGRGQELSIKMPLLFVVSLFSDENVVSIHARFAR